MISIMTDEQVQDAKQEIIDWVTKHISDNNFDVVYQVLFHLKRHFEELKRDKDE